MKPLRPLFFFSALILLVGLACSALGGATEPTQAPPPTEPVQVIPTEPPPQPTEVPPTESVPTLELPAPTEPPAVEAQDFFVEEFDATYNPDNWQYFTLGTGDEDNLVIEQQDDYMLFDLGDEDVYLYFMYGAYTYEDVSLRLNAENRGRNNNNISLVCRMNTEGTQWYEFSVESGGVWYLYAVDNGKYNLLANGGTTALKQGREVNQYQLDCTGDEMTMYVNDQKIQTFQDRRYLFDDGFVGFNISSLNVLPITVNVNWFEIALPE
jgi:hypothetical protein